MAVRIQAQRYAVVLEHLTEHVEVSYDVFLRPEIQAQDGSGGIIDDPMKRHSWASSFEPVIGTGIALEQDPRLGFSLSHASVARGSFGGAHYPGPLKQSLYSAWTH